MADAYNNSSERKIAELKAVNEKLQTEIVSREKSELALRESTKSYWSLFEESPVNMLIEDHSEVKKYIDSLPCKNGAELRIYFNDYPEAVKKCAALSKITDMNKRALLFFNAKTKKELKDGYYKIFTPETYEILGEWVIAFKDGSGTFKSEASILTLVGEKRHAAIRVSIIPGYESTWSKVLVSMIDITERKATEEALAISEANYRAIFDTANDGIFVFDIKTGSMIDVNRRGCEMYCYSKEEMLLTSLSALSAGESPYTRDDAAIWVKKAAAGEPQVVEWLSKDKAGRLFWVEINLRRAIIGSRYSLLAIVRDITERKCAEGRLEKINKVFLNFGTDTVENINRLTALLGELLGADCALYNRLEEDKLFSCGRWNVPPGFSTSDKAEGHICFNVIKNARDEAVVIRNLQATKYARTDPNIKLYKLETYVGYAVKFGNVYIGSLCALYKHDFVPNEEDKRVMGVIASAIGVEEERMAAEKRIVALNKELIRSNNMLKQLAIRDSHTGLYGHRYLQEAIEVEFSRAKRQSLPLSVIMLDIDYFKTINDVYGHQFGDMILRQFAVQLKKHIHLYDIAIRSGGEEFIVISPGADISEALALAKELLYKLNLHNFGSKKHHVKIILSAAVASYPADKVSKGMDLISLADKILNRVKDEGGNRVYSSLDTKRKPHIVKGKKAGPEVASAHHALSKNKSYRKHIPRKKPKNAH